MAMYRRPSLRQEHKHRDNIPDPWRDVPVYQHTVALHAPPRGNAGAAPLRPCDTARSSSLPKYRPRWFCGFSCGRGACFVGVRYNLALIRPVVEVPHRGAHQLIIPSFMELRSETPPTGTAIENLINPEREAPLKILTLCMYTETSAPERAGGARDTAETRGTTPDPFRPRIASPIPFSPITADSLQRMLIVQTRSWQLSGHILCDG